MSKKSSEIDKLYEILEKFNEMEEEGKSKKQEYENDRKFVKTTYSLREWQEASFLEHAKLLLADTSYNHIQKITLANRSVVYVVPEDFYEARASEVYVVKDKIDEEDN